jgi:hypothetical protein
VSIVIQTHLWLTLSRFSSSSSSIVHWMQKLFWRSTRTSKATYSNVLNGYFIFSRIPNSVENPIFDSTSLHKINRQCSFGPLCRRRKNWNARADVKYLVRIRDDRLPAGGTGMPERSDLRTRRPSRSSSHPFSLLP